MNYSIQPIDITNTATETKMRALYKEAFNMPELPAEGYIYKNTNTNASSPSFFIGAMENDELIGCNGFCATDFFINDKIYTCYQSCWSATHPKHQGKKVFVNLINYAKDYLKAKGAGFIFGLPNDNSYPIFIKKLGFKEIPALLVKIPNIPFIKNFFFNDAASSAVKQLSASSLMIKEEQIIALKKQENREPIEVIKLNESYGWGKILKVKKFGITFTYFYLGGVFLKDPGDYKKIINKIFSKQKVAYIQIVSAQSNSWNAMIKGWKKALMNGFIFFDLNAEPFDNINIMFGSIDVF